MSASILFWSDHDEWERAALDGDAFVLSRDARTAVRIDGEGQDEAAPRLHRCDGEGSGAWALITPPGTDVWINGRRASAIHALRHRDAIWLPGAAPVYFSTERPVRVEPFPGSEHTTCCVRCKTPIATGQPACRCPGCNLWHHEDEANELRCWSYDATCAGCRSFATDLDGSLRWLPDPV